MNTLLRSPVRRRRRLCETVVIATTAAVLAAATSADPGGAGYGPETIDALAAGFRHPPASARPSAYYLMLNGYLNRDHARHELAELARAGIGGLCVFDMGARGPADTLPPAGPAFMSDAWLEQFAVVLESAADLGLTLQLCVSSSWDMGAAWVEAADASKALYHSTLEVEGPASVRLPLALPELPPSVPRNAGGGPLYLEEVATLAVPLETDATGTTLPSVKDRYSMVDLTETLSQNGEWVWRAPPGRWAVVRFVCANTGERLKVPSPNSDGLATDHFSARVTTAYIRRLTDRLEARFGDLRGTPLRQLHLPSYEVRGRVWTEDLPAQFRHRRGYDLRRFLPALVGYRVEGKSTTQDFLDDFQKTMGELLVDAYYATARAAAHAAGLGLEAEGGGPGPPVHQVPVDALQALSAVDEMRGEFWPWRLDNDPLWVVKETACAAHIYGRRFVHMEAFTGFRHWEDGPFDLKFSADRAFCEGMNHVVWHTSSHQPPEAGQPGWVYGAGTHLTPNLVWWPMAGAFLDYLARNSFLLQQGHFVADVCRYYGDQGANFVLPKHTDPLPRLGFDHDVANADVIRNRMSVRDGRILLPDGMSYGLLVLPDRPDIAPEVLAKIATLVEQGATVVGPKPARATGWHDRETRDQTVRRLADKLWGPGQPKEPLNRRHGSGEVVAGQPLPEVLRDRGLQPDFQFNDADGQADLDWIHRSTSAAEIYFVQNRRREWATVEARFRVTNCAPQLWHPQSGRIERPAVFVREAAGIRMPLRLAPWGSVFVVFPAAEERPHLTRADDTLALRSLDNGLVEAGASQAGAYEVETADGLSATIEFTDIPASIPLDGPWQLHFPEGSDAPAAVELRALVSWTALEDPAIRSFSGIARYELVFDLPPGALADGVRWQLDLGDLWAVARVRLNGRDLGVLWQPPYEADATDSLRPRGNCLEIQIANTWANRLVGDAALPAAERRTRTNITRSLGKTWADIPLRESGLFGPVRLVPLRVKQLSLP